MAGRDQRGIYCFITDENKKFYRAGQAADGGYSISFGANPYPIKFNPSNLLNNEIEFATNSRYMSLVRSIQAPLDFIKDGAAILRHLYYNKRNVDQKCYLTIVEWDGDQGKYVLSYYGKLDLSEKFEDPKTGTFTVPVVDDSAWGVLSANDSVQYAVDCSPTNPKAIPVLFDGTTLINRYTFQTVSVPIIHNTADPRNVQPFVLINQDGDSAGIAAKSQTYIKYDAGSAYFPPDSYVPPEGTWHVYTSYAINGVRIQGTYSFSASVDDQQGAGGLWIYFLTSRGQMFTIIKALGGPGSGGHIELYKTYVLPVDFTVNMVAGESLFLVIEMRANAARNFTVLPYVTNIVITTKTKSESIIAYGLRAIDLGKELVAKATKNRFTLGSDFLSSNNKDVCFSGDSIRGVPNAKIYSSFDDYFKTFDSIYFLAFRVVNGDLFLEKATEVYKQYNIIPTQFTVVVLGSIYITPIPSVPISIGNILEFSGFQGVGLMSVTAVQNNGVNLAVNVMALVPAGTYNNCTIKVNGVVIGTNGTINTIIDLGEAIDVKTYPAKNMFCNEIVVGSRKQDYRHPSGRLEFNSENTFSLPFENISKKETIVSAYRLGCYDIIFLILDYKGGSTVDNSGDKSVYVVKITDEQATAIEDVETFENVTVNNAPLAPIIKSPRNNASLTYNKPTIKGIAKPGDTVNIYVDTVLDGSAVADGQGNWVYDINNALSTVNPPTDDGIHLIEATFTDLSAPTSNISVYVDTASFINPDIMYPDNNQNLYNNKPLIQGRAQHGTNIDIYLDGNLIGSTVTDNAGFWTFKSPAIPNGTRTLSINLGAAFVVFSVDSFTEYPLITYIGSELDGFTLFNNLPLIEGVAKPGTNVEIWLSYIPYLPLGSAIADANGNWSFQVVPINYIDPVLSVAVVLAPIKNGLNIISTSLENHTVGIVVSGYKLSRPPYSSITGVIDNTVFNTEYSPKRMLRERNPLWAAMFKNMTTEKMTFETADKNSNLVTVIGTDVVSENTDVPASSLGQPFALLEYANVKAPTRTTFAKTLYNFINGGVIHTKYRGKDLWFLPMGSMRMDSIKADVQEWKLLFSPLTSYSTLLNLYKRGVSVNIMQNAVYHSDYNTLHMVEYDFQKNPKYNTADFYEDWFNNRNEFWLLNPDYLQKVQKSDPFRDQIITNGVSAVTLKMFRCKDAIEVASFPYNAVANPPINPPEVVLEATGDLSLYPDDKYFFITYVGTTPVLISERIWLAEKHERTILIEAGHSTNDVGAFFSTGWKSVIRVEGLVKKIQPSVTSIVAHEESGNNELLYSQISKMRDIRFGTAYGLPDYLYFRCVAASLLDDFRVQGVHYTPNDKKEPVKSEDVPGHPLYYYTMEVHFAVNSKGVTVAGGDGGVVDGVILVVDSEAVGLPAGSLININLQ